MSERTPVGDRSQARATPVSGVTPVLEARNLDKSYPGVHAVRGVDLTLMGGEVHALVGENGAGKSTLVNMLTGAVAPDGGTVTMLGHPLRAATPGTALAAGIAAVHQEPTVVPALSPVANVFLGQTSTRWGFRRERAMRARFRYWTDLLELDLPTSGPAGRLSVGAQQSIEIIRALEHGARVVVMDEPTASLSQQERVGLFRIVELLRSQGTAVVFISHKLDDVLSLADVVTVLRDGQRVHEARAARGLFLEMRDELRVRVELAREAYGHARDEGQDRVSAGLAALRAAVERQQGREPDEGVRERLQRILRREGQEKEQGVALEPESVGERMREALGRSRSAEAREQELQRKEKERVLEREREGHVRGLGYGRGGGGYGL